MAEYTDIYASYASDTEDVDEIQMKVYGQSKENVTSFNIFSNKLLTFH